MPQDPRIPNSINRVLREYVTRHDAIQRDLHALRQDIVDSIEEKEAELRSLKSTLVQVDRTLHQVPSTPE